MHPITQIAKKHGVSYVRTYNERRKYGIRRKFFGSYVTEDQAQMIEQVLRLMGFNVKCAITKDWKRQLVVKEIV